MQKQSGECAFSNACIMPGPRVLLAGTNRKYCAGHAALLSLPLPKSMATEFDRSVFHSPGASGNRRWATGVGMGMGAV